MFLEYLVEQFKAKKWYHATTADFDTFDTTLGDMGSHFGSKDQAIHIATNRLAYDKKPPKIITVNLGVYNPLRLTDNGSFHADNIADQLYIKKLIGKAQFEKYTAPKASDNRAENNIEVKKTLLKHGYDGIVYSNKHEGNGSSIIAFNPEDIKIIKKESLD